MKFLAASGTYDRGTQTGGSDGSTMRFAPEAAHAANAGLGVAREALESIKKLFPSITYADLWTVSIRFCDLRCGRARLHELTHANAQS